MTYGSVQQYRRRMKRRHERGEILPVAVSCQECSGPQPICPPCIAACKEWVQVIAVLLKETVSASSVDTYEELARY